MPAELVGATNLRKALLKYAPDLQKEMKTEIAAALKPIVREARGYVPTEGNIMHGWLPRSFSEAKFPTYNSTLIKKGITFKSTPDKVNKNGFTTLASIRNQTAIGALAETAGRANPQGQPWVGKGKNVSQKRYSHSVNPEAGKQFIKNLGELFGDRRGGGIGDHRGRYLYRAWAKNNGKAMAAYFKAVQNTSEKFNKRTSIVDIRRAA